MSTGGYEFSGEQNETFKGLVSGMKRSGIVVAIASLILLAYQFVEYFDVGLSKIPPAIVGHIDLAVWCLLAVVGVVVAALLVKATSAFKAVIHTEGNDVEHLMQGLTRMRGILKLIFVAATVGSLLLGLSFSLLIVY